MKYFFLFLQKTLRYVLKPLSFLPAIIVMYLIFLLSAQDGSTSSELSYKVTKKVIDLAGETLPDNLTIQQLHTLVRKLGHVSEYFILAVTVAFPLYVYRLRGIWLVIFAGLFCVIFASVDEFHQSFVVGRGPSIRDVGIDSIGIFSGIFFVRITGWLGRITIFRPLSRRRP